ncbi:hypothetical protein M3Y97_00044500 [Aphelenchoides bicaudatus]|nr:hypothetical protein M3Y97_00044500 [Aphelenchoides bicaudatus]
MDKDSNFYMNLTFYEVRGTMIGELYRDESSNAVEMMFSVQTSDQVVSAFQSSVAVPPNVNSRRKLCVHPSGNQEAQKCLILNYEVEPMRTSDSLRYHWLDATASCEGCNERGLDGFLESLNPKRWLMNGFQTPTDVFVVVVEATLCIATFLLSILILTKCVIPMIRCLICVARPLKTSSSRKQLHIVEKF